MQHSIHLSLNNLPLIAATTSAIVVSIWWFCRGSTGLKEDQQDRLRKLRNKTPSKNYVEALEEFDGKGLSLFLGGGISGCPDWHSDIRNMLVKKMP